MAHETPDADPGDVAAEVELTDDEALLADAEHYARDYGVSVEEAFSRLTFQRASNVAFETIAATAPATFAGLLTTHEPEFGVTIYLVGDTEAGPVETAVAESGLANKAPVRIDTSRTLTDAQIEELLIKERPALEAYGGGGTQGIGYDLASDEFFVQVLLPEGTSTRTSYAVDSFGLEDDRDIAVRIRIDYSPAESADGYRGGFDMTSCTSGFNIVVNGTRGMTTSAHCPDTQSYRTFGSTTWNATTYRSQALTRTADIQWHTTSLTPGWAFHGSSTSSTQLVTSRTLRTSQSGDYICHRGKSTDYSCGTVTTVSYTPTYSGACGSTPCNPMFVLAQGPSLECYPGDSGGPVFSGGSAYGWYKGQSSTGTTAAACSWMFWMAPDYLNAISGASLLMAP